MAYKDFIIDKRIIQRNLDKGLVDSKQLEKLVAALPDRADNVAVTRVEDDLDLDDDVDDEVDGDDDDEE
jgi:hypothetical protein